MCASVPHVSPEAQIHLDAYMAEFQSPEPDPLAMEEHLAAFRLAQLRDQTRNRIITAAPRRQMDPALAAILRPISPHLKGIVK